MKNRYPIHDSEPIDPDELESTHILPRSQTIAEFVGEMRETINKLVRDEASRGDVKMLNVALKELRYGLKVFSSYRNRRKVTVFGSARTAPNDPSYQQAVQFGQLMAEQGYLTITGAGGGIMEAAHLGAGPDHSLGLNIMLPFEQRANKVMLSASDRLVTLKYFFTRKLMFVKETDAVVLFPGGFGTLDEGFEALTLVQTGKSHIMPIICVDRPGGSYWKRWQAFVIEELLANGLISKEDVHLYHVTDSVEDAVAEVLKFHRVYHSMRYVRGDLLLRLHHKLSERQLAQLRQGYQDIISRGTIEQTEADPSEANDQSAQHLPRLRFRFDRHGHGRLRQLIDEINRMENEL